MNIGDCYVQRLRTTWEYTKRHRSPPLLHTVTSHLLRRHLVTRHWPPLMLSPTDSTLYTCVTSQRGYRVQVARDSTNQSEGARVSDDQSERGSSVDQSEPFSRHATRDGTADGIKDRRLHFSPFPSTTQCGAAQKTRPSSGMTSQRWHPVTGAWPISRSEWLIDLTYIQVRVIDWHVTVLVTGHLAADGGTSGVTSHGDVTVTSQRRHLVTHSRPIRSLENIQNGCHLAADGWTDFNMETIRNGDVTGSTSYHVTPSRPIRSLENIQNGQIQAALYTTLDCLIFRVPLPFQFFRRHFCQRSSYKRPAPSFLTLSFNDTVWNGAKTRPSSGMTSQRWHPVTGAWPISSSEWLIDLTYIQVRVIDWHVTVLVTGHLAADGGTSGVTSHGDVTVTSQRRHLATSPEVRHITWHILDQSDRWKTYRMGATWRPMAEPTSTWKQYEMLTSPEVRHITWHLLDQSDRWKTYRMGRFKLSCILLSNQSDTSGNNRKQPKKGLAKEEKGWQHRGVELCILHIDTSHGTRVKRADEEVRHTHRPVVMTGPTALDGAEEPRARKSIILNTWTMQAICESGKSPHVTAEVSRFILAIICEVGQQRLTTGQTTLRKTLSLLVKTNCKQCTIDYTGSMFWNTLSQ